MHKHILLLLSVLITYLAILLVFEKQIFAYRFDKKLIGRYFCSQDMPYEPDCPRVWLSDEELHIAVGYLYATGSDPAVIDFQHMPFVAYLYGFLILAFGNPYFVEIIFGMIFLGLVYLLGFRIYKSSLIPVVACAFFLLDPLFLDLSSQASYELGQAVFVLAYFYFIIFHEKNFLLRGIALGLVATAKFWGAALFFVVFFNGYKFLTKNFRLGIFLLSLLTAFLVFSLVYIRSYLIRGFNFNIVYLQLKILKYWLDHSVTNIPLASLVLFTTGFFKSWWGNHGILRTQPWSLFWPISLAASVYISARYFLKKNFREIFLASLIPISYLVYLGIQAPFSRYFILILPFCYLSLAYIIALRIHQEKKSDNSNPSL